jgi:hypothetical protein
MVPLGIPASTGRNQLANAFRNFRNRIECACVHVACLGADQNGRTDFRQSASKFPQPHPALLIHGNPDYAVSSETQHLEPRNIDTCDSSLVTTVTGGAPIRPCLSTSQSSCANNAWRAAARPVKLAMVQPVVNPTLDPRGRPKMSTSYRAAMSSTAAAAGDVA